MTERAKAVGAAGLFACFIGVCLYGAANAVGGARPPRSQRRPPLNRVVNGDFALPAAAFSNNLAAFLSPQGYAANKLPVNRIPGWSVGEGLANGVPAPTRAGSLSFMSRACRCRTAPQSLELSDNGPGNISETFKTTPGASYLLTWYGAGYPDENRQDH